MKKTKSSLLVLLALAGLAASSIAQSPSPAKTGTPAPAPSAAASPSAAPANGGDPFDKHLHGKAPDAAAPDNVCFTVEVYALSQDDAAKLLADNPGGEARHDAVLKLAAAGKARFETLLSAVTKSGQRAQVLQIQTLSTPMTMNFNSQTNQSLWNFETTEVGESLEIEPVMSPDKSTCDLNLDLSSDRFGGFCESGTQYAFSAQPVFETRKLTTSMTVLTGKIAFLGTLNGPPETIDEGEPGKNPGEMRLVFGRMSFVPFVAPADSQARKEGTTLEHQLVFYSLDREVARQVLAGDPKPGAFYDAVLALAGKQQARLERMTVLKTKSGQRAAVQEIEKAPYPRDFIEDTPINPSKLFLFPTYFPARNLGFALEVEPVAQKFLVDINLVPQLMRDIGNLKTTGAAAKYPPLPVIELNKVTTSLLEPMGVQAFIGTFGPPGDTGVDITKDTGRVWLGFIRTVYAEP